MKILYLSCHKTLEYDEMLLFKEIGHDITCYCGYDLPLAEQQRPTINDITYKYDVVINNLLPNDIEKYDIIYVLHYTSWVLDNWNNIKHKKVILRLWESNTGSNGINALDQCRKEGLILIRYSDYTVNSNILCSKDTVIKFYKDPNEFGEWSGNDLYVMNVCKSITTRPIHCHYETYKNITDGFNRKLFGTSSSLTGIEGGEITYDKLKSELRNNRVYFYTGTYPAPYTLNFIEALMTGIPVISIGKNIANINSEFPAFEIQDFIKNEYNGFIVDDTNKLKEYISLMLNDKEYANYISNNGRKLAIDLFSKEKIKAEWRKVFDNINA